MSLSYQAVLWNRQKKIYDWLILSGVVLYLLVFIGGGGLARPQVTIDTLVIRGFGTLALLLLHVILSIGPLCRLDSRFLPLLYNRRHLGVTMFLCGLVHGGYSIAQFHALGDVSPLVSVLSSNGRLDSLSAFPFQPLGLAALVILFLMAATSHDFWLKNLTPAVWKTLHTFVYVAYALVVMHVTLGFLQDDVSWVYAAFLGGTAVVIISLHVVTGVREWRRDSRDEGQAFGQGWIDVGSVDDIELNHAKVVVLRGCERIAVYRHADGISAISNVCAHQNGPLGEGRIVDGCVTCPWHGYQYLVHNGQSPPPYTEKIPTYDVRVEGRRILVNPEANPPGTEVTPVSIPRETSGDSA